MKVLSLEVKLFEGFGLNVLVRRVSEVTGGPSTLFPNLPNPNNPEIPYTLKITCKASGSSGVYKRRRLLTIR